MKKNYLVEIISSLFILLFVYTATSKFFDFRNFKYVLADSPLIGKMAPIVAWSIPMVELAIAVLLFFPRLRRAGLWSSLALMLLFTGYLGYMILFTKDRPCSCGGVIQKMSWNQHLIFNSVFILLAIIALWKDKKKSSPSLNPKITFSATA